MFYFSNVFINSMLCRTNCVAKFMHSLLVEYYNGFLCIAHSTATNLCIHYVIKTSSVLKGILWSTVRIKDIAYFWQELLFANQCVFIVKYSR